MAERIKINPGAIRAILTSAEIRAAVHDRAERMASAARSNTTDEVVVQDAGRSRARSYVHRFGSGARGEAHDRALGRSLGGG